MEVLLDPMAAKALKKMNSPMRERMVVALEKLGKEPPQGDISAMENRRGYYRLRVGKFRALFKVTDTAIVVTDIDSRGQIYKR